MFLAALYGLIAGVLLCLTFGTVFFALIQTSLQKGYRSGIQIALGVAASDAIFIFVAIFGTSFLPQIDNFNQWVGGLGIVFLIILGVSNLIKKPSLTPPQEMESHTRRRTQVKYFMKGVALNMLNPVNFMSWAGIAAYLRTKGRYDFSEIILFFTMSLVGVFLTESALAIYAFRLRKFLTLKVMRYVNITTGLVFLGVAARLVWEQFLR